MKIVITGGLGYIGTELCKIYSGESRYKDITVLDSRFVSERVKQLRDWGINYIQCSLFDDSIIETELKNADVIIHLAGITDVAYTKTDSNKEKDDEITRVGIEGTRNIIKYSNPNCKIIFPSTHVVYEGFETTMFNIEESLDPRPVLTYAKGKVQSELDLSSSGRDYVILRLASVYGYSTDTMRIGIMPNLFSKIASQNGTIRLFSGGVQFKSLVPLIDVARCIKFMSDSDIKNEIFHVSKENLTVKDVANICKEFKPDLEILETDDEIPNLGYTISNKKLLSTGFEFRYNLRDSIREMIENWSNKPKMQELEYLKKGDKEYIDNRGKISNYELTEPINLIGYIESKRGTVRANHYHPIQEQKCLLIKGRYISVIKDLADPKSNIETRIVNEGDLAVIQPNVAHTMVFLEDSIFLNLVRGEREHENYGITHTIPYVLVDDKFRTELMENYKLECRSCGNRELSDVISLGLSPLANNLLNSELEECDMYPLEVKFCPDCKNSQLSFVVPPQKMFDEYLYVSSTASSFRDHFERASKKYFSEFNLNENTLVVDIGSNDGIFLKPLKELGVRVLGVEPAKNISELANENGILTLNSYFNDECSRQILENYGKAKVVTASNVFAHSDELVSIAKSAFNILEEDGVFIIEVQYLVDTINDLTFDNIYHEHCNYWTVTSLKRFFENIDPEMKIFEAEHIDTHGGSIRVYIGKNRGIEEKVLDFINRERELGICNIDIYKEFSSKVESVKRNVINNLEKIRSRFSKIAAYGSPAKATTSLNYFGIDNSIIDFTVDDNPLKKDKIIPGVNIPIKERGYLLNNLPDLIIVLAWNFFKEIKEKNHDLEKKGVRFISIKDLYNPNFKID
jgi:nucleoside-diphosphate-sugar epimerase/quercetin dioxygenase-like cupin family protein/SAM-dependent methyltransferase